MMRAHPAAQILSVARQLIATRARAAAPGAFGQAALDMGTRSLGFILLTQAFLGAIFSLQAGLQAQRILGDTSLVGPQAIPMLIRLTGPTLTGLMLAARAGTGIAARLGTLAVTEQLDALRLSGADPVPWLVRPRVLAGLLMAPTLAIIGTATAILAGAWATGAVFGTPLHSYLNFEAVQPADVLEGLLKSLTAGFLVPFLSSCAGLFAYGGSEGVGQATTRAVVHTSMAVIACDFFIGGLVFVLFR